MLVLQFLFKKIGYNSWIYKEGQNRDVYVLETLANFLDFKFNPLDLKHHTEQIGYIRGFFDAEGGIPHRKENKFYIQLVQKDKAKLLKIKRILKNLGVNMGVIHNPSKKVDPEYWRMYVLTNSHIRFVDVVGTWHPVKDKIFRERMKI